MQVCVMMDLAKSGVGRSGTSSLGRSPPPPGWWGRTPDDDDDDDDDHDDDDDDQKIMSNTPTTRLFSLDDGDGYQEHDYNNIDGDGDYVTL